MTRLKKEKQKEKRKYSVPQCVAFMLKKAWGTLRRVPLLCLALAAVATLQSLAGLFIAPEILRRVETGAALPELLWTAGIFTVTLLALNTLYEMAENGSTFARIDVRTEIIGDMSDKSGATSYVNTLDPAFTALREKAQGAVEGNSEPGEYIWTTLTELLTALLGFAAYLTVLRNLDWRLMLTVLATAVLSFLASLRAQRWETAHEREDAEYYKKVTYLRNQSEAVSSAKDIRIFGLQGWLDDVCDSVMRLYESYMYRRAGVYILANAADAVLTVARNGIAYFFLIRGTLRGGLTAAEFLLYFTAVSGFTEWITDILEKCAELSRECIGISQIMEFLHWPEPFRFEGGEPLPDLQAGCELRLENVTYRYPGAEQDTIRGITLTLRPGEKLAVVGLNGAGKTTLVKLMCGFLDPDSGSVKLNGIDIRRFNRREYYDLFSAVFQEFSVLDATVAENVSQSAEDMDLARVRECLDKAGLTEAVNALPKGPDTQVGRKIYLDGTELSGGQIQRLMLARALYKDGPMLVLDEPTAALDPIAENDIYMKYNEMTSGKTSVFISHRLASTRFCDRIIFLADGQIAEEGTHDSLLALGGGYAELFEVQSRYYREGRDF